MTYCAIRRVKDSFGILGNMSPHALEVPAWGYFRTSEHAFQAMRFPRDSEHVEAIRTIKSPMQAKFYAKGHAADRIVVPTSDEDVATMRSLLHLKHEAHMDVRLCLQSTGNLLIVEDCSKRQHGTGLFWGAALQADGTWRGVNMLGVLWMELRG